MNRIILRFCVVKKKKVFETIFDTRLNFIENFKLLNNTDFDFQSIYIFDLEKMVALKKDVPIVDYNFHNFMTLYIF